VAATLIDTLTLLADVPNVALEGRVQLRKVCGLAQVRVTVPVSPPPGVSVSWAEVEAPAASDTLVGDEVRPSDGTTAATPVPVRAMVWGVALAQVLRLNVADLAATAWGVKVKVKLHEVPAATDVPQVVV
jgi:hypothetical protein